MPLPAVLIVGNFLSEAVGNRAVCEELAPRLASAGHRVVITSNRAGRLARLADMLAVCWRERARYDVAQVDVFSGPSLVWAEAVSALFGALAKPFILTLHGGSLPAFARRWPGRVRRLLRSATLVTAPSEYLRAELASFRPDIRLLPNALDLDRYGYRERRQVQPKLVWLRAFHAIYNPAMALEAIALLRARYPSLGLTMAGPDKGDGTLARVRKRAAELAVDDVVQWPGRVAKSDVGRVINAGDIFLNTTNADNTPVSVLEALACGACVVSTNVGGLPYLLENERDALLVAPQNAQEMADAIARILSEPALSARLSAAGRRKAEQMDWPRILTLWQKAFADALGARPARRLSIIRKPSFARTPASAGTSSSLP
jgi:glycosyltransferase involved in cell wall biosynthesis